jgi:uncharacterized protein with HEPN domain
MHPKSPESLDHIVDAAQFVIEITAGTTMDAYIEDRGLRQTSERSFEIIGEALRRL